jgi:hypothetical protein
MLSPALHSLLAEARGEELHRGARKSLGSEVNRPDAARPREAVKSVINRLLPEHGPETKEVCHG